MKKIIEIIKNNKLNTIMSIITFLIGCIFLYDSIGMPLKGRLFALLISFLPCIIYVMLIVLKNHYNDSEQTKNRINSVSITMIFALLFYYPVLLFIYCLTAFSNPVTDVRYYQYKVNSERLLQVFPKEIPSSAEDVMFLYSPGVLQAGTVYRLYYKDYSLTKEKFDNKYKGKATWIGYKGWYTEKRGLFTELYYETPAEVTEDDFLIYLIEGNCDDSGYCNHGDYLFASFNEKTNEVVYMSNSW